MGLARTVRVILVAVVSVGLLGWSGCRRSSTGGSVAFVVQSASLLIGPDLGDDSAVVTFNLDADPGSAAVSANYVIESPLGNILNLSGATVTYSPADRSVTIFFGGTGAQSVNLSSGAAFRVAVVGNVLSSTGLPLLASGASVEGMIGSSANPLPVLAGVTPPAGSTAGGTVLTLSGTGFTNSLDTTVTIGAGLMPLAVQVVNGETATVVTPPGVLGPADVLMMNPHGISAPSAVPYLYITPVPLMDAALSFRSASAPYSVGVGDFDGDGNLDAVVASFGESALLTYRGNGVGLLAANTRLNLNNNAGPHTVRTADFNNDGHLDLMVTKTSNANFWVYLYEGIDEDGFFQFSDNIRTRVGRLPEGFAIADLNADGFLDAAVVNKSQGTISVCLGDGTGAFPTVITTVVVIESPVDVAIGDVDGDGFLDMVTANLDSLGSMTFFQGDGKGNFERAGDFATGGNRAVGIELVDLNSDGSLDAVVANNLSDDISILQGDGMGGFLAPQVFESGDGPIEVRVDDIDADGDLDIVVACLNSRNVVVHPGRPGQSYGMREFHTAGVELFDLQIGDLNNDGRGDLFVPSRAGRRLTVLLSSDDGFFSPTEFTVGTTADAIESADLNGDGVMDFATIAREIDNKLFRGRLRFLLSREDGEYELVDGPEEGDDAFDIELADFDLDGDVDLVVAYPDTTRVTVYLNSGDGTFGTGIDLVVGLRIVLIGVGDANEDGAPDVLAVQEFPSNVTILTGDGTGQLTRTITVMAGSDPVRGVELRDINRDGFVDIVFVQQQATVGFFGYFVGMGNGQFGAEIRTSASEQLKGVAVADFNQDGFLDLVAIGRRSSDVGVVRYAINDGTGNFPPRDEHPIVTIGGTLPLGIGVADVDGDGIEDVLVAVSGSDVVSVFLTNPKDLASPVRLGFVAGASPRHIVVKDLDGDSVPDFVTASFTSGSIEVFLNRR